MADKKTISIRMNKDLMKEVESAAEEDDRSVNSMFVKIVKFWICAKPNTKKD